MSLFLTFQMCDWLANYRLCDSIANYGFSISIHLKLRTVNTFVLHSTVNFLVGDVFNKRISSLVLLC